MSREYKLPETLRALLKSHPKTGKKTTNTALGRFVGIRQQSISLYALGRTYPTAKHLLAMADYFGVTVDYLLTGEDERERYESMYKCFSEREKEQISEAWKAVADMCLEEAAKYEKD